jgi:DNA mismatch endonuclease, patch repair protein
MISMIANSFGLLLPLVHSTTRVFKVERALRQRLRFGKFHNVPAGRSRAMAAVRGKGNKTTETAIRFLLVRAGVRGWQLHPTGIVGSPDFYFAKRRVAVFVDGCFWHGCPKCGHLPKINAAFWSEKIRRNQMRDRNVTIQLARMGVRVLRFWEHEIQNRRARCIRKILAALKASK